MNPVIKALLILLIASPCWSASTLTLGGGSSLTVGGGSTATIVGEIWDFEEDFTNLDSWTQNTGVWSTDGDILDAPLGTNYTMMVISGVSSSTTHACIHYTTLTSLALSNKVGIALRINGDADFLSAAVQNLSGTFSIDGNSYTNNSYKTAGGSDIGITPVDDSWLCAAVTGTAAAPTVTVWYFNSATEPGVYGTWGTATGSFTYSSETAVDGTSIGVYANSSSTIHPSPTDFVGGAN